MRIAENIAKDGMAAKGELLTYMTNLIASEGLTKVIETGTYMGTGSTMAIIDGLTRHGKEFEFHTIEVNPAHFRMAGKNVPKLRGVNLNLGLSVGREDLPDKLSFGKVPKDIIVDHQDHNREQLYKQEVSYDVPDNILDVILQKFDYKPDLVFLDSAGHMGWVEYQYLLKRAKGDFYIVLDDTNHVKHYKSAQDLKKRGTVLFETDDKFGGLCAKISLT